MLFELDVDEFHTKITAIFEEDDSKIGKREEGIGTEITNLETTLTYDYPIKNIHPDILGLICMVNFFPFIGSSVEFPKPVSNRLYEAFQNKCFRDKKNIHFRNIDTSVPKYSGKSIAIAFGGGVDSTVTRMMFPEALVVHEAHIRDGKVLQDKTCDYVRSISNGRVITSNQRYVSTPGGWHSWPCSMVTSLLLATDNNIGIILTGTVQESNYSLNGRRFIDRWGQRALHGPSGNYWQSCFQLIGIPLYSPVSGDIGNVAATLDEINSGTVFYCTMDEGDACRKCTKCFRREFVRKFLDKEFKINEQNFDNPSVHNMLEKRPLYFGNVYSHLKKEGVLPDWATQRIADLKTTTSAWQTKFYPGALDFVPEGWDSVLTPRIFDFFEMMNDTEIRDFESWNQDEKTNYKAAYP